jgi:hypothetical protein
VTTQIGQRKDASVGSLLSRERTVAGPRFNRWLVPPPQHLRFICASEWLTGFPYSGFP